jgi:hypothetical protein
MLPAGVKSMSETRPSFAPGKLAIALLLAGCTGYLGAPGDPNADPPLTGTGSTGGSLPPVMMPPPNAPITGPIASNPGDSSRLVRLSHKQWANTVGDLLRIGTP